MPRLSHAHCCVRSLAFNLYITYISTNIQTCGVCACVCVQVCVCFACVFCVCIVCVCECVSVCACRENIAHWENNIECNMAAVGYCAHVSLRVGLHLTNSVNMKIIPCHNGDSGGGGGKGRR